LTQWPALVGGGRQGFQYTLHVFKLGVKGPSSLCLGWRKGSGAVSVLNKEWLRDDKGDPSLRLG